MLITRFPKHLDRERLASYLLSNYPITDIAETCAYHLLNQPNRIPITRQQFESVFKIIGEREDGTLETRGRKPIRMIVPSDAVDTGVDE